MLLALLPKLASSSLSSWMPDQKTVVADLSWSASVEELLQLSRIREFKGMAFTWKPEPWEEHWSAFVLYLPGWTGKHWQIPLASVAAYFVAIPTLRWLVATKGKWNVRDFAFYWNSSLSLFSWCGVFACVPVLLDSLRQHGFYFTTCAPASWYGGGWCGLFVAFFIYSKVAELVDTVLLLLAKKPVIALQWWHHSTVLLYCWHSYSVRIATGLWFAAMNYSVHSVMYGYFAIVATKYRKYVTPFAIFITLAQLAQMLVGMFVTVKAVLYQDGGHECHVNKTNSVLGLTMYFSYFVLFGKLFIDNYVTQTRKRPGDGLPAKKKSIADLTKSISSRMKSQIIPQMDDGDADADGFDSAVPGKKVN